MVNSIACKHVLLSYAAIFGWLILSPNPAGAQQDSVVLKDVTISAYLGERPVLRLPASVALVDSAQLARQPGQSLVPVLNTVAGVRMEERSPGSYRLSIRGSLLRSPFGVRNVKVYMDELPLTNAGGDTYLNLLDFSAVHNIEVLKGPDGSLFGANSGGVVRISPASLHNPSSSVKVSMGAGSYGMFRENVSVQQKLGRHVLAVNESWQHSDGYRHNSALDRKYAQLTDQWRYKEKSQLRFLFFYSDLNYQTPGGLTLQQFQQDPRAARPATKTLPGAVEQKAAVHNKTWYGGIIHETQLSKRVRHVIAVFGSHTDFENPFITNDEARNESSGGLRTWIEISGKEEARVRLKWNVGMEAQQTQSSIINYGNDQGHKDTIQASDKIVASQGFAFARLSADIGNKWLAEASVSYNYNRYDFTRRQPLYLPREQQTLVPQLMPRVALSYLINRMVSLRGIVSRGYSPPTTDEIRASNNVINTALKPESGWNYEAGFRLRTAGGRLWWDASVFYYKLSQAIVQQLDASGNDHYVNAGSTAQPGLESQLNIEIIKPRTQHIIRGIELRHSYALSLFTFKNYKNGHGDFSGKQLTGVPQQVSVLGVTVYFPKNICLFGQYNYTARIPLNDGNTAFASEYHLVQLKAGWTWKASKRLVLELSAGIDNLLNQTYSLGNDLNAIGGRYYNAAPGRNYFSNMSFWF